MEQFEFSGGVIEKRGDFIMRITFDNKREITKEDMMAITEIRQKIFGDQKYCTLIDARKDFVRFSSESTEYVANNPLINKFRVIEAVLVKNFGQNLGGQLYIKIFKPKSETKLFYKEEKAIEWLTMKYTDYISTLGDE